MIKKEREKIEFIYGTLQECVDDLFERIDLTKPFPEFDFAAEVIEDSEDADIVYDNATGWFGCKDMAKEFDSNLFELIICYYGGSGLECVEVGEDDGSFIEEEKRAMISVIGNATDIAGYGVLNPNDYTIFEYKKGEEK